MEFADREAVKAWIIDNQLARRNLTDVQRANLGLKKFAMESEKAKERRIDGNSKGGKSSQKSDATLKQDANAGRTESKIAEISGVSRDTVHKVREVNEQAPEPVKQAMEAEVISISKAYEATKAAKKDKNLKDVGKFTMLKILSIWALLERQRNG